MRGFFQVTQDYGVVEVESAGRNATSSGTIRLVFIEDFFSQKSCIQNKVTTAANDVICTHRPATFGANHGPAPSESNDRIRVRENVMKPDKMTRPGRAIRRLPPEKNELGKVNTQLFVLLVNVFVVLIDSRAKMLLKHIHKPTNGIVCGALQLIHRSVKKC